MMDKRLIYILMFLALVLFPSCGGKGGNGRGKGINKMEKAKGDSAVYGLASVGCSDSILMLLPRTCDNPQRIDILDAMLKRRVFGNPKVGDEICVVLTSGKAWHASMVLDISELFGSWVYQVMPVPKNSEPAEGETLTKEEKAERDSMLRTFMVPREYGFTLSREKSVTNIGTTQRRGVLEEESPVEYPQPTSYSEWRVWNGKLIFNQVDVSVKGDSIVNTNKILRSDTAEVVMLQKDSLQLRFADELRCYSRQKSAAEH